MRPTGAKIDDELKMSIEEFFDLIGGPCDIEEIDRIKDRYRKYKRKHRQLFIDLLQGKYSTDKEFRSALLETRKEASKLGLTDAGPAKGSEPKKFGGFGRTNDRKFIKLATRVLYLRMTGGVRKKNADPVFQPWPLSCDFSQPLSPKEARQHLVKKMEKWSLGPEAIRKNTRFQPKKY